MKRTAILVVLVCFLGAGAAALAQGGFELAWWTVGAGGASAGGAYTVAGSVSPAGAAMSGGGYSVEGGFWSGAGPMPQRYLPVIMR